MNKSMMNQRGYVLVLSVLGIIFLVSTTWFVFALKNNPNEALWGFLVVNFIFVLGITQFGVAFSAIMRVCKAGWARAYYRIAELITLSFFPFAIIGILYIHKYGSPYLFYWVEHAAGEHHNPWLNSEFLLYRNLLAQLAFYAAAFAFFILGLLPDIKTGNGDRYLLRNWLHSLCQNRDIEKLKRDIYFFSPIILVLAVIANTFIAWDFGMMLVPHYHSSVFPMYFILGNMLAGSAALLFVAIVLSRTAIKNNLITTKHIHSMAILLTGFTLLWLYMFWAQFFVSWFGNLPHEYGVISQQMYGHYAPYFWIMMIFTFMIPIGSLIFIEFKRTWWAMLILTIVYNIGIWLSRYLIVMPALVEGHHPFTSIFEVCMIFSLLSGFLFVFLILINSFPAAIKWELDTVENE